MRRRSERNLSLNDRPQIGRRFLLSPSRPRAPRRTQIRLASYPDLFVNFEKICLKIAPERSGASPKGRIPPRPFGEQNPHPKEYPPIVRIAQGFGNQMKAAVIFAGAKLKALKPFRALAPRKRKSLKPRLPFRGKRRSGPQEALPRGAPPPALMSLSASCAGSRGFRRTGTR